MNGDNILDKAYDTCTQINFNFNFNYYGNIYKSCLVCTYGYIWFAENYFIAAFDHDLDTTSNGDMYYRFTNNQQTLNQIGQEINSLNYLNKTNFMPTNAFIVTWDSVASWDTSKSGYVSFQVILSTDGSNSFLTINYGSLGFSADYGNYFQCGSYSGCYNAISSGYPELSSNVGVNGKWIYNISKLFKLNFIFLNKARLVYLNETRVVNFLNENSI